MHNQPVTEVIRENLSPSEVLSIRQQERGGRLVNVSRLHSQLVQTEIIHPDKLIDVTRHQQYLN